MDANVKKKDRKRGYEKEGESGRGVNWGRSEEAEVTSGGPLVVVAEVSLMGRSRETGVSVNEKFWTLFQNEKDVEERC